MNKVFYLMAVVSLLFVGCTTKTNSESVKKVETEACCDSAEKACCKSTITFKNENFYKADGSFDVEKGKDAIVALAKYHGYNIFPEFRENLWVSDYGTGKYTELGLAAYMFKNNETDKYMLMDLFLLPNQMLPEHWHLDGETNPAKLEGWLVRSGKSYIVAGGKDNLASFPAIKIPAFHMNGSAETKHVVEGTPGTFTPQDIVYAKHWQFGGEEGAVITEVANVHTDAAVRHNDKAINNNFLGI
jgi:D-lyxose ketol-isomerase